MTILWRLLGHGVDAARVAGGFRWAGSDRRGPGL